jgi:hypothetical protein
MREGERHGKPGSEDENADCPALSLIRKFGGPAPKIWKSLTANTSHHAAAMDSKPEVKVPVRLSTRDPSIQLAQEPGPLLVQTSK